MVDLGQKKVNSRSPFFICTDPFFFLIFFAIFTGFETLNHLISRLSQFISRLSKKFNN
jgi:hypothetical protein